MYIACAFLRVSRQRWGLGAVRRRLTARLRPRPQPRLEVGTSTRRRQKCGGCGKGAYGPFVYPFACLSLLSARGASSLGVAVPLSKALRAAAPPSWSNGNAARSADLTQTPADLLPPQPPPVTVGGGTHSWG